MSHSFDHLIDGMIETIRSRVMPQLVDASVRGQAFGIIYALEGLQAVGRLGRRPAAEADRAAG